MSDPNPYGRMRMVIVESPYGADTDGQIRANIDYARACIRDCLLRNESPIASHLLYTQPGILNDQVPEERQLGMEAGWAWIQVAELMVVYTDYGVSKGMRAAMQVARDAGLKIEERNLAEHAQYRTA